MLTALSALIRASTMAYFHCYIVNKEWCYAPYPLIAFSATAKWDLLTCPGNECSVVRSRRYPRKLPELAIICCPHVCVAIACSVANAAIRTSGTGCFAVCTRLSRVEGRPWKRSALSDISHPSKWNVQISPSNDLYISSVICSVSGPSLTQQ